MNNPSSTNKADIRLLLLVVLSHAVSFSGFIFFMCRCGYHGWEALPTSTIGAGIAWYAFVRHRKRRKLHVILAVVIPSGVLVKNVLDILWFGHEALLF